MTVALCEITYTILSTAFISAILNERQNRHVECILKLIHMRQKYLSGNSQIILRYSLKKR